MKDAVREALERSIVAIDDWLNIYASAECDEQRVKEAKKRIREHGTLAYIANVQEQNRAALALIEQPARTCATCNAILADGPQPLATYEIARELIHRFEMESMALHKDQREWLVREIRALIEQPANAATETPHD